MLNTTTTNNCYYCYYYSFCLEKCATRWCQSSLQTALQVYHSISWQCNVHNTQAWEITPLTVLWYQWPLFEAEEHLTWKFTAPDNWNAFCEVYRLYTCSVSTEVCSVRSCQSHSLPEKMWSSSHWISMIKRLLNTPRTQQLCVICSSS